MPHPLDSNAVSRERRRLVLALVALSVGFSVYLLGRSTFVYATLPFQDLDLPRASFGPLAGSLPSFCHMFAFSLATAVLLRTWPKASMASVFVWGLLETAFEVAQWNSALSTFDPFDLLAIVSGGVVAWLCAGRRKQEGTKHGLRSILANLGYRTRRSGRNSEHSRDESASQAD